eukprot:15437762-Alexandrium_andersonii.AAC.1
MQAASTKLSTVITAEAVAADEETLGSSLGRVFWFRRAGLPEPRWPRWPTFGGGLRSPPAVRDLPSCGRFVCTSGSQWLHASRPSA